MAQTDRQGSLGKLVAVGVLTGVVSALAAVAVLRLVGVDLSPAVIAGVAGGAAGSLVPIIVIRKGKCQAAQQGDAADAASEATETPAEGAAGHSDSWA